MRKRESDTSKKFVIVDWSDLTTHQQADAHQAGRKHYRFGKKILDKKIPATR